MHCLDLHTGKVIWFALTSTASNRSVNSIALVNQGVVYVTANSGFVIAYDSTTGTENWRLQINGICDEIVLYQGELLAVTEKSISRLALSNGEILEKKRWGGRSIRSYAVAGSVLCLVVNEHDRTPLKLQSQLIGIQNGDQIWTLNYPRWAQASPFWDESKGLLYESTAFGIGIVDPIKGERLYSIHGFDDRSEEDDFDQVCMPDSDDTNLYISHFYGSTYALRHPS